MAILTGSFGNSFRTLAFPIEFGAAAISRSLPVSYSVFYEAPTGLYATCIGAFSGTIRMGGTSSYTLGLFVKSSSRDTQTLTWSMQSTTAPGVFDTIDYFLTRGLHFSVTGIEFHFKFDSGTFSTGSRVGMVIPSAAVSTSADPAVAAASPHLSILPLNFDSDLKLPGDMYMVPAGLSIPQGLKLMDLNAFGRLYTGSFITPVRNDSIFSASIRATSLDAPTHSMVAWKGAVTDAGFVTVVSGGFGPLIRSAIWGGGLYMPDSATVAVYGPQMSFMVPSGNLTIFNGMQLASGTLNVMSGSIYLRGPVISLSLEGVSASGLTNGLPWASLTQSRTPVVDTVGGTPPLFDGVLLLVPSSSGVPITTTSNLRELHIRISGSWFTVVTQSTSFPLLDGGPY